MIGHPTGLCRSRRNRRNFNRYWSNNEATADRAKFS